MGRLQRGPVKKFKAISVCQTQAFLLWRPHGAVKGATGKAALVQHQVGWRERFDRVGLSRRQQLNSGHEPERRHYRNVSFHVSGWLSYESYTAHK